MESTKFLFMDRAHLEKSLSSYEQISNYVALIPFIGSGAGTLRILIGIIQILGSLWALDKEMALHGCANLGRGIIETTWIFAIVFSYFYDGCGYRYGYSDNEISIPNPWKLLRTISSRL